MKNIEDELYNMSIGDLIPLPCSSPQYNIMWLVTRVHGGWIYKQVNTTACIFVPRLT